VVALEGGGATGIKIISDEAEANLRSAMTAFGAQQGSRNLLSGAATDQPTFAGADVLLDDIRNIMQTAGNADQIEAAIETYFESPTGGFQTRIYQGADSDAPPVNIGNGQTLDMSVRGDNKAIRDSLRGMAVRQKMRRWVIASLGRSSSQARRRPPMARLALLIPKES